MCKRATNGGRQLSLLQYAAMISVTMQVPKDHRLLVLKRNLNWIGIRELIVKHLRQAGCNVDGGPGRPLDVELYTPVLVLMVLLNKNSREMEEHLGESAVARIFIDRENDPRFQVRDHSNIARIMNALGEQALLELNGLVMREAVKRGFADTTILSGDTTAQELPIGYPNEPGILKGLAQRCARALRKLRQKGKRLLTQAQERCGRIIAKAKEHHLFAKTKEKKHALLKQMVRETQRLVQDTAEVTARLGNCKDRVVMNAVNTLATMNDVATTLLPQILHWMKTQRVAKAKILHAGLTEARAIVRKKAGKKVEFGLQYLVGKIKGGYIFATLIEGIIGETKMPLTALEEYRRIYGVECTPHLFVYDRGGWSKDNVKALRQAGVEKVGIQPRGRARWAVGKEDRRAVLSERGKTEGVIGTLKTEKYKFNKPKARRSATLRAAGQRSILSYNLNKYVRDMIQQPNAVA